jgi:hypothetical protein
MAPIVITSVTALNAIKDATGMSCLRRAGGKCL